MKNKIVKSLVACSLITSSLLADTYIGVSYAKAGNTATFNEEVSGITGEATNDYSDLRVKLASGTDGGMKVEFGLAQIKYDQTYFGGDNLIEGTLNIKKEFEVTKSVYPFINAGFGVGSMSVSDPDLQGDSMLAVSFNLGAGLSFKATDNLYIEGGVEYVGRKWQDVEYRTTTGTTVATLSRTDSATRTYAGVNFKF